MFDKTGILSQVLGVSKPIGQMNPLSVVTTFILLSIGLVLFLYFFKQFKLISKNTHNGQITKDEVKIIHKRIDNTNDKVEKIFEIVANTQSDIAYIKGKMEKQ